MPLPDPLLGMPPLAIDLVLLGSFDWRELALLLETQGLAGTGEQRDCIDCAFGATRAAIVASRESPRFRRALARRMDLLAAAERARLALTPAAGIEACWVDLHRQPSEQVARCLWALGRDSRPEARRALEQLLARLHAAALWLFMRPPPVPDPS